MRHGISADLSLPFAYLFEKSWVLHFHFPVFPLTTWEHLTMLNSKFNLWKTGYHLLRITNCLIYLAQFIILFAKVDSGQTIQEKMRKDVINASEYHLPPLSSKVPPCCGGDRWKNRFDG
jgi:hypothetical protein